VVVKIGTGVLTNPKGWISEGRIREIVRQVAENRSKMRSIIIVARALELVGLLLKQDKYIDVIIPRGSAQFIRFVRENSLIPVIETGAGNCHIFVNWDADLEMATRIIVNAKVQRPAVCNAVRKVLVHSARAALEIPSTVGEYPKEIQRCDQGMREKQDNSSSSG
jgi:glutamate-5-semialdehyde dehydrogenase